MMGIVIGVGRGVMPWFGVRLYPTVEFADGTGLDARSAGLEAAMVDLIGVLIPAGGHVMIEYESPGQSQTHRELLLRVPAVGHYLGAPMFHTGVRAALHDWVNQRSG